jgi:hypothetical protein
MRVKGMYAMIVFFIKKKFYRNFLNEKSIITRRKERNIKVSKD